MMTLKGDIDYWVKLGSKLLRHNNAELLREKSHVQKYEKDGKQLSRKCTMSMFERKHKNGQIIDRVWLCFSPSTGKLYCFFCKLLTANKSHFEDGGFCDWKNAGERLASHETSSAHLGSLVTFENLAHECDQINSQLTKQLAERRQYWRDLITRLVSVIFFMSERGLAFRGKDEIVGSAHNGNYLGIYYSSLQATIHSSRIT